MPMKPVVFFLKQSMAIAGLSMAPSGLLQTALEHEDVPIGNAEKVKLALTINGKRRQLTIDPRITLLDLLRERLSLTGSKKRLRFPGNAALAPSTSTAAGHYPASHLR